MLTSIPKPDGKPPFDGIRYIVVRYALGGVLGLLLTVGFLAADFGGLRTLIMADEGGWLAVVLLSVGMWLTFAGAYAACAIMLDFRGPE